MTALVSQNGLDAGALEKVVVGGDLSKLTAEERLSWYKNRCEAAGLDPRTQPFQYLSLQGKLTLYATKAATDQLIASRRLSVSIVSRGLVGDLYEVVCRVTFPDGHSVEDMAALPIAGLRGDALANATMKAVTKAKRRTVLSACGLGMMDETEAETIPNARHVSVEGEIVNAAIPTAEELMAPYGGQDNMQPVETDWARANKRLRAVAGRLGKEAGVKSTQVAAYMSALVHDRYKVKSSKDLLPEQLEALADLLDAGHISLVPSLEGDDDIPPFDANEVA